MKIVSTPYALLRTLFAFNRINNAPYSIVAPLVFINQLSTYHNINIKRSWHFRSLQLLEQDGWITRVRRWQYLANGQIKSLPSAFFLTARSLKLFVKEKIAGAGEMLQKLYDHIKNKDKRGPSSEQLAGDMKPRDSKGLLTHIKDLLPKFT